MYLQLPKRLDPRVKNSADDVTARATNPYDKAPLIERYLRSHYGYTLDLNMPAAAAIRLPISFSKARRPLRIFRLRHDRHAARRASPRVTSTAF